MATSKAKAEERAARAKALLEEQQRRERARNIIRGGIAFAVLVALVGVFYFVSTKMNDKLDEAAASSSSPYGVVIGPATAAHKVVIYEDFLCPFCGALESATHDQLATLADSGTVQVDYRPFDLLGGGDAGSYSVRAAAAFSVVLDKSGATVAKKFHDLLYANQPGEGGPYPTNDQILALAVQAGADESVVKDGIDNATGVPWVTAATAAATKVKVRETPTILLDGKQFTGDGAALLSALG